MKDDLLLLSTSPDFPALTFPLRDGTFTLGRSTKCDFMVNDATVSRKHAEIEVHDQLVVVRDLKSRNGTFVDKCPAFDQLLRRGQQVQFGKVQFLLAGTLTDPGEPNSELPTASVQESSAGETLQTPALSAARRRVLDLLLDGLPEKEIATRLVISPHTVHKHIRAIYKSYDVHSHPELLARLLRTGKG